MTDSTPTQRALDAEANVSDLAREVERLLERNSWHHITTCPYHTGVDLWCVHGYEDFAQYDGGSTIGTIVPRSFRSKDYEFFGNKNKNHVPQHDLPDLIPVAWRYETPDPAPEMIAEILGIPLTREDAIALDASIGKDTQ
jgi:hypothetical protein